MYVYVSSWFAMLVVYKFRWPICTTYKSCLYKCYTKQLPYFLNAFCVHVTSSVLRNIIGNLCCQVSRYGILRLLILRIHTWIHCASPYTCVYHQLLQMYVLLNNWRQLSPEAALELLDYQYADIAVRKYSAVCFEVLRLGNGIKETYICHIILLP